MSCRIQFRKILNFSHGIMYKYQFNQIVNSIMYEIEALVFSQKKKTMLKTFYINKINK